MLREKSAAVSDRSTIGPKVMGANPKFIDRLISDGVKSPSGPININTELGSI